MTIVLIFSMLDSDVRLYEPSPERHFCQKCWSKIDENTAESLYK